MVRHSGFFTFMSVILSVIAAVSVVFAVSRESGIAFNKGRILLSPDDCSQNVDELDIALPQSTIQSLDEYGVELEQLQYSWCFDVSPGAIVVIGSLDLTGARHLLTIESLNKNSNPAKTLDGESSFAFLTGPSGLLNRARSEPVYVSRNNCQVERTSDLLISQTSLMSSPLLRSPLLPSTVNASLLIDSDDDCEISLARADRRLRRRFLVPHFETGHVVETVAEAALVCHSQRVSVFVDLSLELGVSDGVADNIAIVEKSICVCRAIESELLSRISSWIGPIADIDGDGRLAVLITDLDRRVRTAEEVPVLGCVRNRDFRDAASSDFAGDIIYLDQQLPEEGCELNALLAHEISHAAMFSRQLEEATIHNHPSVSAIPSWLNEAVAHWIELQFCATPVGFSDRVESFLSDTAGSPIVSTNAKLPYSARRRGSRASAASFLKMCISNPDDLRCILDEHQAFADAIKAITNEEFGDAFRDWTTDQICLKNAVVENLPLTECMQQDGAARRVFGTAFLAVRLPDDVSRLRIRSDQAAELQITVISREGYVLRQP